MTGRRRARRDPVFGAIKTIRQVAQPDRHKTADRPNPWPKCSSCFHRVPELCPICLWCDGCCPTHLQKKGDDDDE